jgi:tripartite-type tricarboxylate transporter receptor subunit TctC
MPSNSSLGSTWCGCTTAVRAARIAACALLSLPAVSAAAATGAQEYPQRPVRIVVPLSPGGGVDTIARLSAQHLNSAWGQSFVVENRTGAGGSIGVEIVVKATPDGHTLLMNSSSVITNAATRAPGTQGYDPVRDLQPVTRLTSSPYVVAATPSLPASNLKQLLALAKSRPNGVSFASAGVGSITHMGAELLRSMANTPMTHVPYRGVADAYPPVASGLVDWVLGNPVSILPLINSGRLKGIAITSATRAKALPELPTVAESGVPGYEVIGWYGLFAPARTPPQIVSKLQAELKRSLQAPEFIRRMELESSEIVGNTPREFAAEVKAEYDKWRELSAKMAVKS